MTTSLELILKSLGWVMAGLPVAVCALIAVVMIRGAAKDDPVVMSLVMIGLTVFGIGAGILILMYLTDFGANLVR